MSFSRPKRSHSFGEAMAAVVRDAPDAPRRERLRNGAGLNGAEKLFLGGVCCASVSFCAVALMISFHDPDYFSRQLIQSFQQNRVDPIMTGTVAGEPTDATALPVPEITRRKDLKPSDYQIVMVFENEAFLATDDELMRAKVGSVLPGLGTITAIVPDGAGGTVTAEKATLRSAPGK